MFDKMYHFHTMLLCLQDRHIGGIDAILKRCAIIVIWILTLMMLFCKQMYSQVNDTNTEMALQAVARLSIDLQRIEVLLQ